ncbi:expressed unknown protein [Seminavis robusta]|uniref:Uncharacterized protein n=1 Tax=Seminavis robusta TaxID=568900 RepID=A0A9N8HBD4_9STRA|nr:expressed unknown protein [Seminavis robusta]|eukprot:Sro178_g078320.1 n/a (1052) ;mRNA; r:94444-97693
MRTPTFHNNLHLQRRRLLVGSFLLVLLLSPTAVQADFMSFVRSMTGRYERRNFWFYWYLYKKKHQKLVQQQNAEYNATSFLLNYSRCNFSDPDTLADCPPTPEPVQGRNNTANNWTTVPVGCLDNPDDPQCQPVVAPATSGGSGKPTGAKQGELDNTDEAYFNCLGHHMDKRFCERPKRQPEEEEQRDSYRYFTGPLADNVPPGGIFGNERPPIYKPYTSGGDPFWDGIIDGEYYFDDNNNNTTGTPPASDDNTTSTDTSSDSASNTTRDQSSLDPYEMFFGPYAGDGDGDNNQDGQESGGGRHSDTMDVGGGSGFLGNPFLPQNGGTGGGEDNEHGMTGGGENNEGGMTGSATGSADHPCQVAFEAMDNNAGLEPKTPAIRVTPTRGSNPDATKKVEFSVAQSFQEDGNLAGIAVVYTKASNEELVCDQRSDVPWGRSKYYEAKCSEDGEALVDLYIHDATSTDGSSLSSLPVLCGSWQGTGGRSVHFQAKLPCDCHRPQTAIERPDEDIEAPPFPGHMLNIEDLEDANEQDSIIDLEEIVAEAEDEEGEDEEGEANAVKSTGCAARVDLQVVVPKRPILGSRVPPIRVISSNGASIIFAVVQTWKTEGTLNGCGVLYLPTNGEITCDRHNNLPPGRTKYYMGQCRGGNVDVLLFLYDPTFSTDVSRDGPAICEPWQPSDDASLMVFRAIIPCTPCGALAPPPTPYPTTAPSSQPSLSPFNYYNSVRLERDRYRPTEAPSVAPSESPSLSPSSSPTDLPANSTSNATTLAPSTLAPSSKPDNSTSGQNTSAPTAAAMGSSKPDNSTSSQNTSAPTAAVTGSQPTDSPTTSTVAAPGTVQPTSSTSATGGQDTTVPTTFQEGTASLMSLSPVTSAPTNAALNETSTNTTQSPSSNATGQTSVSFGPSESPSGNLSATPSKTPSITPSVPPSHTPSSQPSSEGTPSTAPSTSPSQAPSPTPSESPTQLRALSQAQLPAVPQAHLRVTPQMQKEALMRGALRKTRRRLHLLSSKQLYHLHPPLQPKQVTHQRRHQVTDAAARQRRLFQAPNKV